MFGPATVASMRPILERDIKSDSTTVLRAAMMLPLMGKLKQEDVGKYLVELVKYEKTHDAVRLWAFKGMRELFPIALQPDDLSLDLNDKNFYGEGQIRSEVRGSAGAIHRAAGEGEQPDGRGDRCGPVFAPRGDHRAGACRFAGSVALPKKGTRKEMLEGPVAPTLMRSGSRRNRTCNRPPARPRRSRRPSACAI